MLTFDVGDRKRLTDLMCAYSVVDVRSDSAPAIPKCVPPLAEEARIPSAFSLMKLVLDHPAARDSRILGYLNRSDGRRALALALQRARTIRELSGRWRDVVDTPIADPRWYAAALLVPLAPDAYGPLARAALTQRGEHAGVDDYTFAITQSLTKEQSHV